MGSVFRDEFPHSVLSGTKLRNGSLRFLLLYKFTEFFGSRDVPTKLVPSSLEIEDGLP